VYINIPKKKNSSCHLVSAIFALFFFFFLFFLILLVRKIVHTNTACGGDDDDDDDDDGVSRPTSRVNTVRECAFSFRHRVSSSHTTLFSLS